MSNLEPTNIPSALDTISISGVDSEGLDHIFESENETHPESHNDYTHESFGSFDAKKAVPISQAAILMGYNIKQVIKLLKHKQLCGIKGKKKRDWMVNIECLQSWLKINPPGQVESHDQEDSISINSETLDPALNNLLDNNSVLINQDDKKANLSNLCYKLTQELEAASYRIGYLESELEQYRERVKLLPDLQLQKEASANEIANLQQKLVEVTTSLEYASRPWWERLFIKKPA